MWHTLPRFISLLALLLLTACGVSRNPAFSPDILDRVRTRDFSAFSEEHVLLACERTFYSFADNVQVVHGAKGISAVRPDCSQWHVSVETVDDRVRVRLDGPGSAGAYRLFFARLSYVLGVRPDYVSCADAMTLFDRENGGTEGFAALCDPASDAMPALLPVYVPGMPIRECNECP